MRTRWIAYAAAAAALLTASPALAQQIPCGPSKQVAQGLAEEYGERATAGGLDDAGRLVQIFANAETGSWTALITRPDGVSCILSAGESWVREAPEPVKPKGEVS